MRTKLLALSLRSNGRCGRRCGVRLLVLDTSRAPRPLQRGVTGTPHTRPLRWFRCSPVWKGAWVGTRDAVGVRGVRRRGRKRCTETTVSRPLEDLRHPQAAGVPTDRVSHVSPVPTSSNLARRGTCASRPSGSCETCPVTFTLEAGPLHPSLCARVVRVPGSCGTFGSGSG